MKEIRRLKIAEEVQEKGNIKVTEISRKYNISSITVHRDLDYLEKNGILHRIRGGAIANNVSVDYKYPSRVSSNIKEKHVIASAVVNLISEGDTLFIDGSTTNLQVAKEVRGIKNLVIFTNSPYVMMELLGTPDTLLYCVGGLYSNEIGHFIGSETEEYISRLHYSKCIVSARAISLQDGITGTYPQIASVQRRIIANSSEVIIAADHTKYGKTLPEKICQLDKIAYFIVDSEVDFKYVSELEKFSKVIVAK